MPLRRQLPGGFVRALALGTLCLGTANAASAQGRPAPIVTFEAAWVGFADDEVVSETMVGGTGAFYISRRVAIGPEIVYIDGLRHHHLAITGNVTVDLRTDDGTRRVTPFFVAGAGLFRTVDQLPAGSFASNEGAFTVGGGVRARAGRRVVLGVDARFGWELHARVGGFAGIRLGD